MTTEAAAQTMRYFLKIANRDQLRTVALTLFEELATAATPEQLEGAISACSGALIQRSQQSRETLNSF